MPVKIIIDSDINLNGLLERKSQGYMVEATPHVGNMPARALATMALGLRAKLVDINVGEKDNIFYPHLLIKNGVAETIAPSNLLTTHNKVGATGQSLCEYHTAPLKRMGLPAICHSEWIAERRENVHKVLSLLTTDKLWGLWTRYVNVSGVTEKRSVSSREILDAVHKVSAPANGHGWVIPNPVNILLDLVFGASETDKDTVYMLSGESMYRYISKNYSRFGPMDEFISAMYDMVANDNILSLPKVLTVKMVPTPVLQHFVAPESQRDQLDAKLYYSRKVHQCNRRVGIKFSQGLISEETKSQLHAKRKIVLSKVMAPLAYSCASSETGVFYTQHDLAQNSERIYIPEEVKATPFNQLKILAENMQKFSK
jgi:hypothetical protein